MLAQIFMMVPSLDSGSHKGGRVSRLHYLIDALIGIDSTKEDPFMLLTIRPKWPVPTSGSSRHSSYVTHRPMTSLSPYAIMPRHRKQSAAAAQQSGNTPHQALSVDRIRGQNKIGKVKMLEFSEAKNWAEIEQTHIRLFEFQPGSGSPMIHPVEPFSSYHYRRK